MKFLAIAAGFCLVCTQIHALPFMHTMALANVMTPTISDMRQISQIFLKEFPGPYQLDQAQTENLGDFIVAKLKGGNQELDSDAIFNIFHSNNPALDTAFFVKIGNDFISVASTFKTVDGLSTRGSTLGYSNPAYKYLLSGSGYEGKVTLFGKDYMAKYDVLKDVRGQVIGAYLITKPL